MASYTVEHYLRDGDDYVLQEDETESKSGTVGERTEAEAKDYGLLFTAQPFEQAVVAADGSTVVKIYYNATEEVTELAAGDLPGNMTVISDKESTLAPGITQRKVAVYDKNGDRVEMIIASANPKVDTVEVYANYKDNQSDVWGMQKTTEQAAAFEANHPGKNVIVAINASYFNTSNGSPTGAFVMEGKDASTSGDNYPFFAVMKNGSYMIGAKGEYSANKGNIQEAIGGWIHLVKDGAICSGLNDTEKYPRQTIGLKADGTVVIMTSDGNQAPKSSGLTIYEQAQVMLSLGCVEALHLDGGGSATYCAKEEGSDALKVVNSPSNGSERPVSNTLIIVSTAQPDGTFNRAVLTAEDEYITPGSSTTVTAMGVDASGGSAEIPADAVWQVADSTMGTVENGVFTAGETTGTATVQMVCNGTVVGQKNIQVVVPDAMTFGREQLVAPYGSTVDIPLTLKYGVNDVKYNIEDITFTLADENAGSIDGLTLTAPNEDSGITGTTLTAVYQGSETSAAVEVRFGKGSEVIFDFEEGTDSANLDNWIVRVHDTTVKSNELGNAYIVNRDTGRVHDGDQALAFHTDFSKTRPYGSSTTEYFAMSLSWGGDPVTIKGAQSLGFWIYIPEDAMATEITLNTVYYDTNGTALRRTVDGVDDDNEPIYTPYWSTHMEESGWQYVRVDLSEFSDDLYIKDEPNLEKGYKRNFFIKMYCVIGQDTLNFSGSLGDFTYYIDNITVDYSDVTEDRERPVFGAATACGNVSDVSLTYGKTPEVSDSTLFFTASVDDNTDSKNYTGIDAATAKVTVDGTTVPASYANGLISSGTVTLADGYHIVRFEIADNNGNVKTIKRTFTVNAGSGKATVKLVPHDASLDRIPSGALYWVDLVSDSIADVKTVEVTLDLNSIHSFELAHMDVAKGFEVSYSSSGAQAAENIAVIRFTRNDEALTAGNNVLASIPVRVWSSETHLYSGYESYTPAKMWKDGNIAPRDICVEIDKGVVSFTDETSSCFSGKVRVDTESYTYHYNMDKTYYVEKGTYHVHTETALDDKAATCTEEGYSGRTYCAVCDSVVTWGTTYPAIGHKWEVNEEGKLACANCTELFNGEYTDGKLYIDGVVAADGWVEIDGVKTYYCRDGVKLTGSHFMDGVMYTFDDNGIYLPDFRYDGFYEINGTVMYFVANQYYTGVQRIGDVFYNFDENGMGLEGDVEMCGVTCKFDDGVSVQTDAVLLAGILGDDVEFVIQANGDMIVDGSGPIMNFVSVGSIPWYNTLRYQVKTLTIGKGITSISRNAFYNLYYLNTVTFEDNSQLKEIGVNAFGMVSYLKEITIPDSVTAIQDAAFSKCLSLEKVTIGPHTGYFAPEAFKDSNKVTLNVVKGSPAETYAVNKQIPYTCYTAALDGGSCGENAVWTLDTEGTLTISGSGAMADNASGKAPWKNNSTQIKKVVIGKDITKIGQFNFAQCKNLTEVVFEEGSALESIGWGAFGYTGLISVSIPDSVVSLDWYAFYNCSKLETVSFGAHSKLAAIGGYAFWNDSALKDFYVPDGLSKVEENAFLNATANATFNVAAGTFGNDYFAKYNIVTREPLEIVLASGTCGDTSWVLNSVGTLTISGEGAMADNATKAAPWESYRGSVKKVVNGKDVTYIGKFNFFQCHNLAEVVFEEGSKLQTIGWGAFGYCNSLTEVTIPASVKRLDWYAFYYCTSLETVNFGAPSQLGSIGGYAFWNDSALKDFYVPDGLSKVEENGFLNATANATFNVAAGTFGNDYFAKYNNVTREPLEIVLTSGTCGDTSWELNSVGTLTISGEGAMADNATKAAPWESYRGSVKKVVIGKNVTYIGKFNFFQCRNLAEVVFEEGSKLQTIGWGAFGYCNSLTEVTIPASVKRLDWYAFYYCTSLKTVNFGADSLLSTIGGYAFWNDAALKSFYVPDGLSKVEENGFLNATANATFNVAKGTFGHDYFKNCNIEIREPSAVILASGTCGDTIWKLNSVGTLTVSGEGAMADNATRSAPWETYRGLVKEVVIGKDVTRIGKFNFFHCDNLTQVVFEEDSSLQTIGWGAFGYCNSLTEVTIPDSVKSLDWYAFYYCTKLAAVHFGADSQLASIGGYAFWNDAALASANYPANVKLGENAFLGTAVQ